MLKYAYLLIVIPVVLMLLVLVTSSMADGVFNHKVKGEIKEFFNTHQENMTAEKSNIISILDLEKLPVPVQRWLIYSQIIGKERIQSARSKQTMVLRLKEKQKNWMTGQAEQYFSVEQPGFLWKAKIKAAPLIYIVGRDKYDQGEGNMLIKILSMFTVADASGKEINQGSLVRYLAEIVWIPSAALNDYISWEEIDSHSAKATMNYQGVTVSGVFMFNSKGEVTSFEAKRYGDFDGEYRMETWYIEVSDYKEFEGVKVPTKGEITWKLASGDYNWYKFEVKEMEFNKPMMY